MLVVRCAACKAKIWKYDKIGPGSVLRCHKKRISVVYGFEMHNGKVQCPCGKDVGIDKGSFYKMIAKAVTYSGTKRSSR